MSCFYYPANPIGVEDFSKIPPIPTQLPEEERLGNSGGKVVRPAAGRKDRHSKVCTAKGPRDRRVRLAAHTAIQFYDVQDRLGFDRPSKAVDWLMEHAKPAIDRLAAPRRRIAGDDALFPPSPPPALHPFVGWNSIGGGGGSAYGIIAPAVISPMAGQSHLFTQREPLQSSFSPSFRNWASDPLAIDGGGFFGFRAPARFPGVVEDHGGSEPPPPAASHY